MSNYDLLVAVVRDKGGAASLNSSIFLVGASMLFMVALVVLLKRGRRTDEGASMLPDDRET